MSFVLRMEVSVQCTHKHIKITLSNLDDSLCLEPKSALLLLCSAYTNGRNLLACESSEPPNAMPCLDGIRAISALLVIAHHFGGNLLRIAGNSQYISPYDGRFRSIFNGGSLCVDTFFVLSAFLATNKMLNEYSK